MSSPFPEKKDQWVATGHKKFNLHDSRIFFLLFKLRVQNHNKYYSGQCDCEILGRSSLDINWIVVYLQGCN